MGRVSNMVGNKRNAYRVLVEKPEGKRPLEDRDVGGRIILKRILENRIEWYLLEDRDRVVASCEHSNEPSQSIKCWEVLE
jgi:hypothetical protein